MFRKKWFSDDAEFATPFQLAWRRLRKNKPAVTGLVIIILSMVVALLGYLITPDSTPNANRMIPEIALQRPGYHQEFLLLKKDGQQERTSFMSKMIFGKEEPYTLMPVVGEAIVEDDSIHVNYFRGSGVEFKPKKIELSDLHVKNEQSSQSGKYISSRTFVLGTDTYGRDILSRLLIGLRISLAVGTIAVIISLIIGVTLGAIAGYFPGRADNIIMWLINVIWAIPTLLLVFGMTVALGKGFWQIFIAVGLTMWVSVARIVRGQVISIRNMEYVEAAQSLGFRNLRIIIRHILPNTIGPVMVIAASNFATAILLESGLSFLGIGVQPPTPSWGTMIRENYSFIISSNPFLALVPGIAIMILVLAFNLLGSGLRDALDVKSKLQ